MLKIRRPLGRLIFNMGIAIPGKTVFLIETAPRKLLIFMTVCFALYMLLFLNLLDVSIKLSSPVDERQSHMSWCTRQYSLYACVHIWRAICLSPSLSLNRYPSPILFLCSCRIYHIWLIVPLSSIWLLLDVDGTTMSSAESNDNNTLKDKCET